MLKFVFLIPLFFGLPEIQVSWTDSSFTVLHIRLDVADELLSKCLKSGLEMEYAFETQLCRRRAAWFDACARRCRDRHRLSFEPISGSYTLVSDRLDDEIGPQTRSFSSLEDARRAMAEVEPLNLEFLAAGEPRYIGNRRAYVRVRAESHCKGDYNRTLARISSFLTLGLVRISGFDTGWTDFKLLWKERR